MVLTGGPHGSGRDGEDRLFPWFILSSPHQECNCKILQCPGWSHLHTGHASTGKHLCRKTWSPAVDCVVILYIQVPQRWTGFNLCLKTWLLINSVEFCHLAVNSGNKIFSYLTFVKLWKYALISYVTGSVSASLSCSGPSLRCAGVTGTPVSSWPVVQLFMLSEWSTASPACSSSVSRALPQQWRRRKTWPSWPCHLASVHMSLLLLVPPLR